MMGGSWVPVGVVASNVAVDAVSDGPADSSSDAAIDAARDTSSFNTLTCVHASDAPHKAVVAMDGAVGI